MRFLVLLSVVTLGLTAASISQGSDHMGGKKGHHGKGPCAKFRCHHKKDASDLKSCMSEKKTCMEKKWSEHMAKMKDGVPAKKKESL